MKTMKLKRNNFKTKKKRTIPLALLMIVLVCVAVWAPTITGIVMVNHIGKYPIMEPFFSNLRRIIYPTIIEFVLKLSHVLTPLCKKFFQCSPNVL